MSLIDLVKKITMLCIIVFIWFFCGTTGLYIGSCLSEFEILNINEFKEVINYPKEQR